MLEGQGRTTDSIVARTCGGTRWTLSGTEMSVDRLVIDQSWLFYVHVRDLVLLPVALFLLCFVGVPLHRVHVRLPGGGN